MKSRWWWSLVAAVMLFAVGRGFTQDLVSLRLTDTVDRGAGNVDLLKDMTPAALEAYRSANGGKLVFGVDINEAANGTEKASSQGVTVTDAWLEVRLADGSIREYGRAGAFSTETQAVVAATGQTIRRPYYTLLGESGSSRITSSNAIQNVFDSTLKITVPDRLDGVVSAVLRIRLLDTNARLGDPEAFYDYTAGFEDLAILTPPDARYIDTTLVAESSFRSEAPAMELSPEGVQTQQEQQQQPPAQPPAPTSLSWVHQPGLDGHYLAAYEDLAPERGDYDFNDLVVAYRYQLGLNAQGLVERIEGTAWIVARGSTYRHDWTLDLPLPAGATGTAACSTATASGAPLPCDITLGTDGRLRWRAFQDTLAAMPAAGTQNGRPVNTPAGDGFSRGPKSSFTLTLATPVAPPPGGAGSPWLFVRTTGVAVRLGDTDPRGYPFALLLPADWKLPVERVDMGLAYPSLATHVGSGGTRSADWYRNPVASQVQPWGAANWGW